MSLISYIFFLNHFSEFFFFFVLLHTRICLEINLTFFLARRVFFFFFIFFIWLVALDLFFSNMLGLGQFSFCFVSEKIIQTWHKFRLALVVSVLASEWIALHIHTHNEHEKKDCLMETVTKTASNYEHGLKSQSKILTRLCSSAACLCIHWAKGMYVSEKKNTSLHLDRYEQFRRLYGGFVRCVFLSLVFLFPHCVCAF